MQESVASYPPDAAHELIGESDSIREVRRKISVTAASNLPVLIEGETGTGKELVARQVHAQSRGSRKLVTVDCLTIPENLIESELFGYSRGAFTGAIGSYAGRLQDAHLGTVFFDEIGSVSLSVQAKLLRFLETGEYPRMRESSLRRVDVRVISATSRFLSAGIAEGRIRKDFYYRLSAHYIWISPLRERVADIALLADHILREAGCEHGANWITPAAMKQLECHSWPGNVRELRNTLLANLAESQGRPIENVRFIQDTCEQREVPAGPRSLRGYLESAEREYLTQLLMMPGGMAELARAADVSVRTLQRKLGYYQLR